MVGVTSVASVTSVTCVACVTCIASVTRVASVISVASVACAASVTSDANVTCDVSVGDRLPHNPFQAFSCRWKCLWTNMFCSKIFNFDNLDLTFHF